MVDARLEFGCFMTESQADSVITGHQKIIVVVMYVPMTHPSSVFAAKQVVRFEMERPSEDYGDDDEEAEEKEEKY
ncbi:hypothetical protein GWI33_016642 [Rhynchophorus ferrugineus]|uniref:Uncharacterized protein n=1 Tax=Rhynchophorus ferrugineus TaxID=354439 RepID=A0A834I0L3_RHYFE|nr:hypothetical protein GWI33_016642 [Rhynchophorus ferrugineus]